MKELIIIGAGGMGREVFNYAQNSIGFGSLFVIKGFLDYNQDILDGLEGYPPILGNDETYIIQPNDVFVSAIGDVTIKQKSTTLLKERGAFFYSLIHKTAIINSNVKIGVGCLILPHVTIGSETVIDDYAMIQNNAVIGHDAKIGKYCRLDCFTMCVGGVVLQDLVTIHTNSVINHNVVVSEHASVGACSFVIKSVKMGSTVFGSPAKELPLPKE